LICCIGCCCCWLLSNCMGFDTGGWCLDSNRY
jgi:hypothetical protein